MCVLLCPLSYPGQILDLCVGGDAGIAFPLSILHIPQVEHTGNYIHQLLRGVERGRGEKTGHEEVESEEDKGVSMI